MADDVRDEKGRFLPGNNASGGKSPGRPRTEAAEKLKAALEGVVANGTLPKWQEAMKKRLARGDQWATEFIFERIAGKVPAPVELSGPDAGPIQIETFDYQKAIRVLAPKDEDSES